MTTTTQARPLHAVLVEAGVSAFGISTFGISAWMALSGASKANLPCGRDGWYGLTDVHRIRTAPTLVA